MNTHPTTSRPRPHNARPPRRRGGAVLEMAIAGSLLIYLTLGMIEYGYLLYVKNTLTGAAREGARVGAIAGSTSADVKAAVDQAMATAKLSYTGYQVVTTPANPASATTGQQVGVTVSLVWQSVNVHPLPTALGGYDPARTVHGSTTMRRE